MTQLHVLGGPDLGQAFALKNGGTYVGRSPENDIQIEDGTVSRRHLKIIKRDGKYSIIDLESQNGTFYKDSFVSPHVELPIEEGVPIAIGMSVICLGEGCVKEMMPFLESVGFAKEIGGESGIFRIHKDKTNQRKLEFLYKVSRVLDENLPVEKTLKKMLDYVFDLLKEVDTGAFILVDPELEKILSVISKTSKPDPDRVSVYCPEVVSRVIKGRKPLAISNVEAEEKVDDVTTLKILKIRSVLCAPLIHNSQIVGVIYIDAQKGPFGFSKEDVSLFIELCQQTALFLVKALLASELTTIADTFPPSAHPRL
jgi:3',5'-cyclic-nucleotide phosphodiesterase